MVQFAHGQAMHRLVDLGPIAPPFTWTQPDDCTFGINCEGQVCGSMLVNGERHAFLWMPRPKWGLA